MNLFELNTPFPAKVLSISDFTAYLKGLVEKDTLLSGVWLQGEVSNLVVASSGHCYFTLKDDQAVVKAALWATNRRKIGVNFKNGDFLMVFGNISVYPQRGEYQIIVNNLRQAGVGALYEAYEKLKIKLQNEGLFDESRKMKLPLIPKGVGVVTSPRGAVIQDIFRVIRRRFINMPIYLVPVKVQGNGVSDEIASGIERLNSDPRVDVIIIGRGGGSIEDLWSFNEEVVARAIEKSTKPIVSAVGHETDVTIADLVADRRAATPSVAGEIVVPVKIELKEYIARQQKRLAKALRNILSYQKQSLRRLAECRFLVKPSLIVAEKHVKVMNIAKELDSTFQMYIQRIRHRCELLKFNLKALDPNGPLKRGYVLVTSKEGSVLNSVDKVSESQKLDLHFVDGIAEVTVGKIAKGEK